MENTEEYSVKELGVNVSDSVDEEEIAKKVPSISSAGIALRNSLKLMKGKNGGGFYVRFLQDAVSKFGWIELLIEYPDGSVKSVVLFKNAFRQTDTDSSGIYRGTESRRLDPFDDNYNYNRCDFGFAENFSTPTMPIPGQHLWDLICENYARIPITVIHKTSSLESVYMEMAVLAATYSKGIGLAFMDSEAKFYVTTADFRNIAERNEWRVSDLRVEFDKLGLFDKDKKSGGYQKTKKMNGKNVRFYVLRKLLPETDGDIVELDDLEYAAGGLSKAEKQKEAHKKEVAKLRGIIQSAYQEQRPPTAVESQS